jgi:hypothetical protein
MAWRIDTTSTTSVQHAVQRCRRYDKFRCGKLGQSMHGAGGRQATVNSAGSGRTRRRMCGVFVSLGGRAARRHRRPRRPVPRLDTNTCCQLLIFYTNLSIPI